MRGLLMFGVMVALVSVGENASAAKKNDSGPEIIVTGKNSGAPIVKCPGGMVGDGSGGCMIIPMSPGPGDWRGGKGDGDGGGKGGGGGEKKPPPVEDDSEKDDGFFTWGCFKGGLITAGALAACSALAASDVPAAGSTTPAAWAVCALAAAETADTIDTCWK